MTTCQYPGDGPYLELLAAGCKLARADARVSQRAREWLDDIAGEARLSARWRFEGPAVLPSRQGRHEELVEAARALGWPDELPPGAVKALAERFGVSRQTVRWHLRSVVEADNLATAAD